MNKVDTKEMRKSFAWIVENLEENILKNGSLMLSRDQSKFLLKHLKGCHEGYLGSMELIEELNKVTSGAV